MNTAFNRASSHRHETLIRCLHLWWLAVALVVGLVAVCLPGQPENRQTEAARQAIATASREHPYVNSLGMRFVPVPGTDVLFSVWETRVEDYRRYAEENPRVATQWQSLGFAQAEDHPVVNVSRKEAKAFCRWLTKRERAAGRIGANQSYRLPADWEWSVAVGLDETRSGTPSERDKEIEGVYPWGTQWPPPRGAGNYGSGLEVDAFEMTSPVGSFSPNDLGLYDLGGNVWEWCEDFYHGENGTHWLLRLHPRSRSTQSPASARVLRGASWGSGRVLRGRLGVYGILDADHLLSSARFRLFGIYPVHRAEDYGFRCVLAGVSPER